MKKVASILMSLVLVVFASFVFTACGDKYKNMKLVVYYATYAENEDGSFVLGENGERQLEWKEIDYEKGLEFVLSETSKNNDGSYVLKMYVDVVGTKKKVSTIDFYCEGSFALTSVTTVKPDETFDVVVPETGSTTMYFKPIIKSDEKSVSFNAVFYDEVESITANKNCSAAVIRDGSLNLNELIRKNDENSLILYNQGEGEGKDTNQDGVVFSILKESNPDCNISYDEEKEIYTVTDSANKTLTLEVKDNKNIVKADKDFAFNYITINVESIFVGKTSKTYGEDNESLINREKLKTDFDVKIVDSLSSSNLHVYYSSRYNQSEVKDNVEEITLYPEDNNGYDNTNIILEADFVPGHYNFDTFDSDTTNNDMADEIKYDVYVCVGDSNTIVKVDGTQIVDGIIITDTTSNQPNLDTSRNKSYNIKSTQESSGVPVKFIVGFDNLLFTGKDYSLTAENLILTYDLIVESKVLPTSVNINGEAYTNKKEFNENIFTEYKLGGGLELNVNAARNISDPTEIKMYVYTENDGSYGDYIDLKAYNFKGVEVSKKDNAYLLTEFNNLIYLCFDNSSSGKYPTNIYIDFKVRCAPTYFDGVSVVDDTSDSENKYITVTLNLNVVGTLENAEIVFNNENVLGYSEQYLVESDTVNEAKINLISSGAVKVEPSTVTIKSKNNNKILSVDNINWVSKINCGDLSNSTLYIKGANGTTDNLVLETVGGNNVVIGNTGKSALTSCELKFVDVVSSDSISLSYDKSYINTLKYDDSYYVDDEIEYQGYYLAMQRGKTSLFTFSYNNGISTSKGIYKVQTKVLSENELSGIGKTVDVYSNDELNITTFSNGYNFNIGVKNSTSSVAPVTVVCVDVYYYVKSGEGIITSETKRVYLEIACYTPVSGISVEATEDEIYYVNSKITDKSRTNLTVNFLPSNATKNIYFSDNDINQSLNSNEKNNTGYIYYLDVKSQQMVSEILEASDYEEYGKISGYNYLDLTNPVYGFEIKKADVTGSIVVEFVLKYNEFGQTIRTTKEIKLTKPTAVEGITVTGAMSNNVYLSIQSDKRRTATLSAKVSNIDATYKNLGYELYENNNGETGVKVGYTSVLSVEINNTTNIVTLKADSDKGGKFILRIGADALYDDEKDTYKEKTYRDIYVNIGDGTLANPFYLYIFDDVENIKTSSDKHYVLASDIDLSKMTTPIGEFTGSINGVIEINDGKNIFYTQHKFTNLTLANSMTGFISTNAGTLKNLVFENVKFNYNISEATGDNVSLNIGTIAGVNQGTITNSAVYVEKGSFLNIFITDSDNDDSSATNYSEMNIGAYVGKNEGTINFYHEATSKNNNYYKVSQMAIVRGLTVNVNTVGNNNTSLNLGVIGVNTSTINGNFYDTSKDFDDYLTAEVNIALNVNSEYSKDLSSEYSAKISSSIGGFVGLNNGTINQVSTIGTVEGYGDKISIGGLVGKMSGTLKNSSTYAMTVVGGHYFNNKGTESTADDIKETEVYNQYVGGAVGELTSGEINNVYVLFIDLSGKGYYNNSLVKGVDVVGGLVGKSDAGTITYANVHSFVDYSTIIGDFTSQVDNNETSYVAKKSVAGLVAENSGVSINYCYVKADICVSGEISTTEENGEIVYNIEGVEKLATISQTGVTNSYFIGTIQNVKDFDKDKNGNYTVNTLEDLKSALSDNFVINENSDNQVYSLVYGYTISETITDAEDENSYTYHYGILYSGGTTYYYHIDQDGVERYSSDYPTISNDGTFNIEENGTIASEDQRSILSYVSGWDTTEYIKYNTGLPVILDENGNATLIAIAESLVVKVSDYEFKDEEDESEGALTIYKNENGIFIKNDDLTTAIVFIDENNSFNLVSENGVGIIDMEILPPLANETYFVKVLEGGDLISRVGNKITFLKAGRVKLEFISMFNSSIRDYVVIYAEYGVDNLLTTQNGEEISKLVGFTGTTESLNLDALFNGELSGIDTNKLLIGYEVINNNTKSDDGLITITALGGEVETGYYNFNDLSITVGDILSNSDKYTITIKLYLDLSKYLLDNDTITDIFGTGINVKNLKDVYGKYLEICEKEISLTAYQTAQDVKINSTSRTLGAGEVLDVEIEVLTSYKDNSDSENSVNDFTISGKYLKTDVTGKETLVATIEIVNGSWLGEKLESLNVKSVWEIFDIMANYTLTDGGYVYNYYFELKEDYKKLISLNDRVAFKFTFLASTNNAIYDEIEYVIEPQGFHNIRIENFAGGVATTSGSDNICEFNSSERPSSIIEPGTSGLIKVYVDSEYSRVDELMISSSTIYTTKSFQVQFQQMYYDEIKGCYVSLPGIVDGSGSLKITNIVSRKTTSGEFVYDGVIYVRTILDSNIIGTKDTVTITVNAIEFVRDENGNKTTISKTELSKYLILETWYKVGLTASVSNALTGKIENDDKTETQVYLIEKNSNNVYIDVNVVGYENYILGVSLEDVSGTNKQPEKYITYTPISIVPQNDAYLVRYKITTYNLEIPFKIKFEIEGASYTSSNSAKVEYTFYPVDYIPSSISVKGSANDVLTIPVNSSKSLGVVWNSVNQVLNSNSINNELKINILDYFYIEYYSAGAVSKDYLSNYDDDNDSPYYSSFYIKDNNIFALEEDVLTIHFDICYDYVYKDGKFGIVFGGTSGNRLTYTFRLNMVVNTSEEEPLPIYDVEGFINAMSVEENYILMNDIDLTGITWSPITPKIKSLDGNGKVITLGNIQASRAENEGIIAGLFTTIPEGTIIKNLVIDVSRFVGINGDNVISLVDENATSESTYFGFLAGRNEGLIYNCEILCLTQTKSITIKTSSEYSYIGLLVGENTGNITNSRVGTEYFEDIDINTDGTIKSDKVIKTRLLTVEANGIVAGFVASNSGIISASYYHYVDLINNSTKLRDDINMTAGFVAINTGKIYNSYVSGKGMTSENVRATKNSISATGFGSSAGFVYTNEGIIENCYTNILVKSKSSGVAGFVFNNSISGVINQCYSASSVKSENTDTSLSTELPFVGAYVDTINANMLMSFGELNNCYYLQLKNENAFDTNFIAMDENKNALDVPKALSSESFSITDNLANYAFVEGSQDWANQGVWTYYTTIDKNNEIYNLGKTSLPQLTSANQIARSIRYMVNDEDADEQKFYYVKDYTLGSQNNPYIIRNYNEYNSIFNISSDKSLNTFSGYVRFVDDISFKDTTDGDEKYVSINTSLGYTLGDENNFNLTVIDGNGMKISNVKLTNNDNNNESIKSLGLFNEIYYSVIKNLDIEYADFSYSSTNIVYSGGLAGKVKDSYLINLDLKANNTKITAQNFAGGVVGLIDGNSGLFNITSDLSVEAAKEATRYYQYMSYEDYEKYYVRLGLNIAGLSVKSQYENYLKNLSYAGGVAGVIDIGSGYELSQHVNINKITVGSSGTVTVVGDIAGFVTGYFGRGVFANKVQSVMSDSSYVFGGYISAGLAGENYGRIRYSQVSYKQSTQEEIDKIYADYIVNKSSQQTSLAGAGNLAFVTGETKVSNVENVAGGLVGVNYGGQIEDSYSKASISANSSYVGGLVGVNVNGVYHTVYTQGYVDLTQEKSKYIGGLIGWNAGDSDLTKLYKLKYTGAYDNDKYLKIDQFVSSMIVDYTQLSELATKFKDEKSIPTISYVVAKSDNPIKSIQNVNMTPNDAYYLQYNLTTVENLTSIIKGAIAGENGIEISSNNIKDNVDLYLDGEKQLETFENLFGNWNDLIWEKDRTKFFPILNENPQTSAYEIRSEDDLYLVRLHPDADFIVYGTIELQHPYCNYVLDLEFTGTMTGYAVDTENPGFSSIRIYTDDSTNSAGFFKKTTGATFNNINFIYDYLSINNSEGKENVGLLSAEDSGSSVTKVDVSFNDSFNDSTIEISYNNSKITHKINDNCYVFTTNSSYVVNFGGLYGTSSSTTSLSTTTLNCNVNINVDLLGNGNSSNIGGIAGVAKTEISSMNFSNIIMNSSFNGTMKIENAGYIGGIVGSSSNSAITGCLVENSNFNITGDKAVYFGGIAGSLDGGYIHDSTADISLPTSTESTELTLNAGGIVGLGRQSNRPYGEDADILNVVVKLTLNSDSNTSATKVIGGIVAEAKQCLVIEKATAWTKGEIDANKVTFGGIVARVTDNNLLKIDECFAYIENNESDDYSGLKLVAKTIVAGGFIGSIESGTLTLEITNSSVAGAIWAYDDNSDNQSGVELSLGGMIGKIGEIEKISEIELKKYEIEVDGKVVESYTNKIENCFTTLVLETSQFDFDIIGGNDHSYSSKIKFIDNYNVSAIVGLIDSRLSDKIEAIDVFYSSDMNLAVEEKGQYFKISYKAVPSTVVETAKFVDLSASALYSDDENVEIFTVENGWTAGHYGLPYRTSLSAQLLSQGFISSTYGDSPYSNSGSSLRPKQISITDNEFKIEDNSKYSYYLSTIDDTELKLSSNGYINGFITFSGATLKYSHNGIINLSNNSVISNLQIDLVELNNNKIETDVGTSLVAGLNNGGLVTTNNGTIFNVTIDYYHKTINSSLKDVYGTLTKAGGLVQTNNGNMLYVNNVGTIEGVKCESFGGLVNENNGFIAHSTYIGTTDVTENMSAGIVSSNYGIIYNTYSAGEISISTNQSTFVLTNNGLLVNCYYDKYANTETYTTDGLISVTTKELQSNEKSQSKTAVLLGANWTGEAITVTYNEKDIEETTDIDEKNTIVLEQSYNYGYPIYNIKQVYYNDNDTVEKFETTALKGLKSGNGTKDSPYLIKNIGTLMSISDLDATSGNVLTEITGTNGKKYEIGYNQVYFKLINDIDFKKAGDNSVSGYGNATIKTFSGYFTSGERFERNSYYECIRYINNAVCALFDELSVNANILKLAFGSSNIVAGSSNGLIANKVNLNNSTDEQSVTITNILFGRMEHAVSGKDLTGEFTLSGTNAGALVGVVENDENEKGTGSLNISYINTWDYAEGYKNDLYTSGQIVGFTLNSNANNLGGLIGSVGENCNVTLSNIAIANATLKIGTDDEQKTIIGKDRIPTNAGALLGETKGTVKLSDAIDISLDSIFASTSVGGIAGVVGGGELKIDYKDTSTYHFGEKDNDKTKLNISSTGESYIGGIAGQIEKGTVETAIGNFGFVLGGTEGNNDYFGSYVGGLVGMISDGTLKGVGDSKIAINVTEMRAKIYAGGIAGVVGGGEIDNFEVNIEAKDKDTVQIIASGFGGVSGNATGGTIKNVIVTGEMFIYNINQLGGVFGCIDNDGNVTIAGVEISTLNITRTQNENLTQKIRKLDNGVGGIVGVMNGELNISKDEETSAGGLKITNVGIYCGKGVENVGGLIGLMNYNRLTTSNNSTLGLEGIEISGVKNVGGMIGQYASVEQIQLGSSFEEMFKTDSVTVVLPNEDSGYANVSNVGGIFGYYNSTSTMLYQQLSIDTGETSSFAFENKTNVMTSDDTPDVYKVLFDGTKASDEGKYSITNVGGIAGLTNSTLIAGTNYGNIIGGVIEYDEKDFDNDFRTQGIINATNVGGIVGNIEFLSKTDTTTEEAIQFGAITVSGSINGYQSVGGIIGSINRTSLATFKVTDESTVAGNVSVNDDAKVYGYKNIGMFVGTSTNLTLEASTENATETLNISLSGELHGFENVGGVVGSVTNNKTDDTSTISGLTIDDLKVKGVLNVGGIVGVVDHSINISKMSLGNDSSVLGNANVGGVIGFANTVKTHLATLSDLSINNLTITAKNLKVELEENTSSENEIYYIPSSIGLVAGYASNVLVDGGSYTGTINEEETASTISSLGNYIAKRTETSGVTNFDYYYKVDRISQAFQTIENTKVGVGGLFGTFTDYTIPETDDDGNVIGDLTAGLTNFPKIAVNIYMPNGINVGGSVGYWSYESGVTRDNINLICNIDYDGKDKEFGNAVYVAGGVGVGGIVGKIDTVNTDIDYFTDINTDEPSLNSIVFNKFNLQSKQGEQEPYEAVDGTYVGAIAGIVNGNMTAVAVEGNQIINNTKGDSYGGIVGKLKGNLKGYNYTETKNLYEYTYELYSSVSNDLFYNSSSNVEKNTYKPNFGGLVGTLDYNNGVDVYVLGIHSYPFTVYNLNSWEVEADTNTIYLDKTTQNLMTVSHMIGSSNVNISYPQVIPKNNPTRSNEETGWHKEYTLFQKSTLSNEIDSNGTKFVSTAPVYDASGVLKVQLEENEENKICYTIYKSETEARPYIYTRTGILTKVSSSTSDTFKDGTNGLLGIPTINGGPTPVLTELDDCGYASDGFVDFGEAFAIAQIGSDDNNLENAKYTVYGKTINTGSDEANGVYVMTTLLADVEYEGYSYSNINGRFSHSDDKVKFSKIIGTAEDKSMSWNAERTWSLFDVVGNADNRDVNATVTTNKKLTFKQVLANIGGLLAALVYTVNSPILALFNGPDVMLDGIDWYFNTVLNSTHSVNETAAGQFIHTTYAGNYGLMANTYSVSWEFDNYVVGNDFDDSVMLSIEVYEPINYIGGQSVSDVKWNETPVNGSVIHFYHSVSRPSDYNAYIELNSAHIEIHDANGDRYTDKPVKMKKYQYYNGAWYINSYATEDSISKQYITDSAVSKLTGNNILYFSKSDVNTGLNYYVMIPDANPDLSYAISMGIFGDLGLNKNNISQTETQERTVIYTFSGTSKPEGVEGLDYLKYKGEEVYWKIVSIEQGRELQDDYGEDVVKPLYQYTHEYGTVSYGFSSMFGAPDEISVIQLGYITPVDDDGLLYLDTSHEIKSFDDLTSHLVSGEDITDYMIKGSDFGSSTINNSFDDTLYFTYYGYYGEGNESAIPSKTFTYGLYCGYPDGYYITSDGTVYKKVDAENIVVFDISGNSAKLDSVSKEELTNYYIYPDYTDEAYKVSNNYHIDSGIYYAKNNLYGADVIDSDNNLYRLYKYYYNNIEGSNYIEGKNMLKVSSGGNDYYIYTRYELSNGEKWNCVDDEGKVYTTTLKDYLLTNGLLPSSGNGYATGYEEMYMTQTVMVSYSGYKDDGTRKNGIIGHDTVSVQVGDPVYKGD